MLCGDQKPTVGFRVTLNLFSDFLRASILPIPPESSLDLLEMSSRGL